MKKTFTLLCCLAALRSMALDPSHFTINRVTAPYFIVDANSPATINKAYVGFEIINNSNSAVTYSSLKFTITSIGTTVSGQNYTLLSPVNGITNVGTLAPGQSRACYYYVSYPASVTPQASFNVQLSDLSGTSKTQAFVIRNRSSISANAGGTATQTITNQDQIGAVVVDDVTYVVGNVQNGDENDFQVAVSAQFDPTKITLLSTQVIASSVPGINVGSTDSLYFLSGNGSNGSTITIRWTFKIIGFNFTTYLLPCAGATSGGSNYKFALNTALGSGTPITVSAAANPLTITKASDKPLYGINSPAVFTITLSNPGAFGVTVDRITDELPAGFTFQSFDASSQVNAANSTSVPLAGSTGTINFEGGVKSGVNTSYYIPAGGSIILKYNALSRSSTASNLLTTVREYIGTTEAGSAQNTVHVSATLPLVLTKFEGAKQVNSNLLQWETSFESNTSKFIIERSAGVTGFLPIGEIAASGNSTTGRSYQYIDRFPSPGMNTYRLKMQDIDGSSTYSRVISLDGHSNFTAVQRLFPNPAKSETSVEIYSPFSQKIAISIHTIEGRMVRETRFIANEGINEHRLDLNGLPAGTYGIQVKHENGSISRVLIRQ